MRILVTGSSGHLGEALMRALRRQGRDAVGIDVRPGGFTDFVGSIADRPFVRQCLRDVQTVLHAATLHKPHVATHSKQEFVDTNITGTLNLLDESVAAGVGTFIFTSTTSVFGEAMIPSKGDPAVWVTEEVVPAPRNIYGVTKVAAEGLCQLFHRNAGLPCLILRTSRFFPEEDDSRKAREAFADANLKVNEFLHRRVDIEDVVNAHLLAIDRAAAIGFAKYIISGTTPFAQGDIGELRTNAPAVVAKRAPESVSIYERLGWKMAPAIDRVYVNERARRDLGWQPRHDFRSVLERVTAGGSPLSELAETIGVKGYHDRKFDEGPYPVHHA